MNRTEPQLYLASQSPRRRELLDQIGLRYQVLPVSVTEQAGANEPAADYVQRVALDKARAGWAASARRRPLPVLGADTEVVVDNRVQGKPRDRDHGLEMLSRLSGRSHEVLSAVAVVDAARAQTVLSRSRVWFGELSRAEIEAYWQTGEPADKAGGYAIQGLGAAFVRRLDGSFSAVMGLPLYETVGLLAQFGIDVLRKG